MHPLNPHNFGATGIGVSFYNGTSVVTGYVVKQTSATGFDVTDGVSGTFACQLAPTSAIATALSSNPTYCTIPVESNNSSATGGTFTPAYGVQSATVVSSTGTHWNVGDSLALPSGAGALTVATLTGGAIATVTVGTAGSYASLFSDPTTGTRAAGSGATFTAHYAVDSATIVGGGSGSTAGYAGTNVLTLTGTGSAAITVDTVDGGGGILTFHVSAVGTVTSLPSNPVSVTGGAGTGATFNLKWKLLSITTSGGTGYNVGDTLGFTGLTATTTPTASIATVTGGPPGAPATFTITAGSGITVAASGITSSTTTATFHLKYSLLSVSSSGGSGYAVNDLLNFNGMVVSGTGALLPTAHISTATSGAATATTVDTHGVGITTAATSINVGGATEYAMKIWETKVLTVEGNYYNWARDTPIGTSAIIRSYPN